jgi:hypothetical protein
MLRRGEMIQMVSHLMMKSIAAQSARRSKFGLCESFEMGLVFGTFF